MLVKLTSPAALLLLALALAGGAAALAHMYLKKREAALKDELASLSKKKEGPMVQVVVPRIDAAANAVLNGNLFVSRPVEDDLVYPDTLLAKDFPNVEGMRLARPVLRGRPVRMSDLQQPVVNDVAAIVPQGSRAMTIDIDNLNSIAQTLRPLHHVDIFLLSKERKPQFGDLGGGQEQQQAILFMQDMVVLATGKEFRDTSLAPETANQMARPGEVAGAEAKGYDSITLLVTPAQAAKLMVGQKLGAFRVVLRGSQDRDALALKTVRASDVLPSGARSGEGIEFIVGGRGGNMIHRLAVPPSQSSPDASPSSPIPAAVQAATLAQTESAANQPVPVLRGSK
jgi:pilus assembly protein CpaB